MIFEPAYQKIDEEPNDTSQKPVSQINVQQPQSQQPATESIIHAMDFVPPPINDSSKYHDQLQNDFLDTLNKNPNSLDYILLFGEKRPLDIMQKKLPEPLFVDGSIKTKMKKVVRGAYQKMIENLKYCAGQMPINYGSPLTKIQEKSHEFMILCEQVQVAETKTTIWKIMQDQTRRMKKKSEQIQEFIEGMVQYCKNSEQNQADS